MENITLTKEVVDLSRLSSGPILLLHRIFPRCHLTLCFWIPESIKVLDRICDVNALPVTDKDVCKTLIVKSLQQNGEVNMVIERPVEQDALNTMEVSFKEQTSLISFWNFQLERDTLQNALNAAANPNAPRVTFHDAGAKSHMSLIIGCDTTLSQQGRLRVSGSYLTMSKETNSKFGLAQ
ncbi:unnamed protein product [Heligmosomoides polygyrus]|uniref:ANF_receptor domain-containing protein n=1 Tax=Heligmosomoides polygyrus TaxID=6339 RepID=A0A183G501_HELPZ|nr:unnamed protein product [Heligmosomoides polygyrus]